MTVQYHLLSVVQYFQVNPSTHHGAVSGKTGWLPFHFEDYLFLFLDFLISYKDQVLIHLHLSKPARKPSNVFSLERHACLDNVNKIAY